MHKWEYLVVFIADSKVAQEDAEIDRHLDADLYMDKMNVYGDAGWELITFDWTNDGAKAVFKRPKA